MAESIPLYSGLGELEILKGSWFWAGDHDVRDLYAKIWFRSKKELCFELIVYAPLDPYHIVSKNPVRHVYGKKQQCVGFSSAWQNAAFVFYGDLGLSSLGAGVYDASVSFHGNELVRWKFFREPKRIMAYNHNGEHNKDIDRGRKGASNYPHNSRTSSREMDLRGLLDRMKSLSEEKR